MSARITCLALVFSVVLNLHGCHERQQDVPCKMPDSRSDGRRESISENGVVKLSVPGEWMISPSADCKSTQSLSSQFWWVNGKFYPVIGYESGPSNPPPTELKHRIAVSVTGFGKRSERKEILDDLIWRHQLAEPAFHSVYPLLLYKMDAEKSADGRLHVKYFWGIKNTKDPITGHPFSANCDILPAEKNNPSSVVDGDFATHGDSSCWISMHATKADVYVGATVQVWAKSILEVDKMVAALSVKLNDLIQE